MPKAASIIFLLLFSAMQYGKLFSYWNCRIINSNFLLSTHCDCEKILTPDHHTNGDFHTAAPSNIKTEDWTNIVSISERSIAWDYFFEEKIVAPTDSPSNGFCYAIFQPPRQEVRRFMF